MVEKKELNIHVDNIPKLIISESNKYVKKDEIQSFLSENSDKTSCLKKFIKEMKSEDIEKVWNLNFVGCKDMIELPDLRDFRGLEELVINNPNLEIIPEYIGEFSKLRELYIGNCPKITQLPITIGNLRNLIVIRIRNCINLTTLPDIFHDLTKIDNLFFEGNSLSTFPPSICKLEKLLQIHAERNKINKLPDCFNQLNKLRHLYLDNNNLSEIPKTILKPL
jgi:Leucine-rich repeat (LRR) protein